MNRVRWASVGGIALGTGLVSVAFGCLFISMLRLEAELIKINRMPDGPGDSEADVLVLDTLVGPEVTIAMVTGTLGSALIAGSLLCAVFQLRWFARESNVGRSSGQVSTDAP